MRTRRSYFSPNSTIPRRSKKQTTNVVEPEFHTIVTMADNRTMAQMLQAPIEGYEDAIVEPQINANNFELKQTLINLIAASLEDKLDIRMNRFKNSLNDMKNSFITPTTPLKAVEEDSIRNDATEPQRRTVPVETSTSNALVSKCDGVWSYDWSYQAEEEPANYAIMAFSSSSSSSDTEIPSCSKACSKSYAQLHTQYDKLTDDFCKSQFDVLSYQAGTFMPPKPDLVFHTAPIVVETDHSAFTVQLNTSKPVQDLSHTNRPTAPIIEDWVSDSEDEYETIALQIVPSFVQSTEQVKPPRHSIQPVETSIPVAPLNPTSPKSNSSSKRRNRKTLLCVQECGPFGKGFPSPKTSNSPPRVTAAQAPVVSAAQGMKGKWVWRPKCPILDHDSGNMSYLSEFKELKCRYVSFGGNPKGGKITGKGKIKTCKLDFDDVYFVKELKFNLFSVSQMCDKKNSVLFTDTECLVLSPDFKIPNESQVLLRVPRENNMYNVNLKNISRFTWVFFLATKDETSPILKTFITGLENQLNVKVKVIKSDNGTNFKNSDLNQFCRMKGIKREFSVPRTPQQNGIAERKNRTLIKAARTMLADSLLPIPFWAEAFNTTCYNNDEDAAFDEKEHDAKKPESKVNVSSSSKFQDSSENSSNEVNAAGTIVPTVGQNSSNNTNPFSAAGPSNTTASPTHGKSSFKDASQIPDDPNMPELEDITYFDNENDVGAEVDFNNLETSIIEEPKRVHQALKDPSWIEAMQEELHQFKMQKVWVLVELPHGKRAIGTKWVYRNKKDERGITIRNKVRLVAQGHTQEEGINYEEVFAPVARIEAIILFLAYASFIGFMVYKMDVKSAFLYGIIEGEVYVCQPLGFEDLDHPDKVYKVVKVKQKKNGIFISQDKYVSKILRKFRLTKRKSASTPIDTEKPLLKDPDVKRIFRYLKGKPHLGLWYPKDSSFDLVAYSDSDYAGTSLDRKSITGGCQFLGCRLIS
nr:retrotransposon protein, putative, Ty1-copia subclass [Tanacetum cinerariifolium]